MPKNKGKGGKSRTRGKNEADDEKRELVLKKDGQEYAQVFQRVNNDYCEAKFVESRFGLLDGTKYLCHIRGKRLKKVRIAIGDIILVGLHDFQDDKPYVILKYMADEIRLLQAYGELPNHRGCNCGGYKDADDDADIEFEDVGMDKI
ncbi:Eukaryotic translation initiation factor 1A [Quillaja saponaria]|uniref:Eukaryotic translation initiation factor 1A n=1 Tax=Quillaja saponaria TaxID=32244 RepID=A0AAD7LLG5_QUISA|nr:Eukaryotic translation initiation factor 1A [Quillaja saponaria]